MRRRGLLAMVTGAAGAWTFAVAAQQRKLPTVGYLGISSPGPFAPLLAALREAGFVDGQNVRFEFR